MWFIIILVVGIFLLAVIISMFDRFSGQKKLKEKLEQQYGLPPVSKGAASRTEFESIETYWQERCKGETLHNIIDDFTWDDLDMDDVFERLNSCQTSVGEEYLYSVLHEPVFSMEELEQREKWISFFEEHPQERMQAQLYLARMGKSDYNGVATFCYHANVKDLNCGELFSILPFLPLFFLLTMFFMPGVGLIGILLSFLVNMGVYYFFKRKIEHELATVRYLSAMLSCISRFLKWKPDSMKEIWESLEPDYRWFASFRALGQMGRVRTTEADFLGDYINMLLFIDLRNYHRLLGTVKKHRQSFLRLYRTLGELDMAISTASFRESLLHVCVPEFSKENTLVFKKLGHPLLKEPVTNTGELHSAIVTGSNASGKSTFVKALAVNGILAQTIHTCTAAEFKTRPALVITSMAVRDSLSDGDSYFVTEIKSLRRILRRAEDAYCVCYVDEILKGTNTLERIAASACVLSHLRKLDCLCITASHDIELTELLEGLYENWHFCETITKSGVQFDYKLKNGPARTRNAIRLLSRMEFPKTVTEGAEEMVEQFLSSGSWALPQKSLTGDQ